MEIFHVILTGTTQETVDKCNWIQDSSSIINSTIIKPLNFYLSPSPYKIITVVNFG